MEWGAWRVVLAVAVSAGSIIAADAGHAAADTIVNPSHRRIWTTDDGWRAAVAADRESIVRIQPLSGSGLSREAYVNLRAWAGISRKRPPAPGSKITATLESGYQIGCMTTLNEVTPALSGSFGLGGNGGIQTGPVFLISPQALIQPGIQASLSPGKSIIVSLGKKPLESDSSSVTIRSGHITVDGCIGPATIRSFSVLSIRTNKVDDQNAVYGRVIQL
ncbi:MspA family porin [Gordonia sp. X0973]|uniref:MspA family porin n=1 Tax=Gordonia sp. X0973 TaxID=2742602 RepID=UPI000F546088|nr:MspA family porin [Gordonia sp. X0973]QKT08479.1 MspA family porin [Gordonia sp. X0973]